MTRRVERRGERVRLHLEPVEVGLLRDLHDGLRSSLEEGDPSDPALRRLFPAAVTGDEEADAETRRLLHDELLAERLRGLEALIGLLDRGRPVRGGRIRLELEEDEPSLLLGVLNAIRLAIGARIGVEELDRAALDPGSDTAYRVAVMDHLGALQEQLLAAIDPEAVRVYDEEDLS